RAGFAEFAADGSRFPVAHETFDGAIVPKHHKRPRTGPIHEILVDASAGGYIRHIKLAVCCLHLRSGFASSRAFAIKRTTLLETELRCVFLQDVGSPKNLPGEALSTFHLRAFPF